ncbi:glucose-6-phosphate isomerase [Ichthyobacterium seriolicida]|uniref:Glucose-6-phosphate isomerase n=1 Tax=Ichthyobacterium seriolicida TaxID=242600 RepID=A0A1J1DXM3_9FLAO|nr:glucose-6-phosphate isomerase [Ichthyobacterium seriolicida]BAV94610.1 glucose-6-phosphate isomerase [Ichthyobacterium seriolicida]
MLGIQNPTETKFWKKLQEHFVSIKPVHMKDLFSNDENRFEKLSVEFNNILIDYSKNIITQQTLDYLFKLAEEMNLCSAIEKMFHGENINFTEGRSVLHTALRSRDSSSYYLGCESIYNDIEKVLERIKKNSESVISKEWKGYSGRHILDVVHIGVGGSSVGVTMVCKALECYKTRLNIHFINDIDEAYIRGVLDDLNPETTLVIVASKTFTTRETIINANLVKKWFLDTAKDESCISKHFIAVTAHIDKALEFGICRENIFEFWDWVVGRYSLWSSVGLTISLYIGFDNFKELLRGGHQMDEHFRNTPINRNIPVILALIGIWYNNFFGMDTEAIFTYNRCMKYFVPYIQQLSMESNGKCVDRSGKRVNYQTGPVVWGGDGIIGQHSFYQLIHQGTKIIPSDFIVVVKPFDKKNNYSKELMSNFFAQTEALMMGKIDSSTQGDSKSDEIGIDDNKINCTKPFSLFVGNRPSNSIMIKELTPRSLGSLIAMYEHKIFTQGVILNIFSFDQWGVELGKNIAVDILDELNHERKIQSHNSSTNGLINAYKQII